MRIVKQKNGNECTPKTAKFFCNNTHYCLNFFAKEKKIFSPLFFIIKELNIFSQ